MKSRGMLMSGPLVVKTMAGLKTETRRVITPRSKRVRFLLEQLNELGEKVFLSRHTNAELLQLRGAKAELFERCPYGKPGDEILIREAWSYDPDKESGTIYNYRAAGDDPAPGGWRPSIHMPYEACRLRLLNERVSIERIQDITTEGIAAEGFPVDYSVPDSPDVLEAEQRAHFIRVWDQINGKRSPWSRNDWVYALKYSVKEVRRV